MVRGKASRFRIPQFYHCQRGFRSCAFQDPSAGLAVSSRDAEDGGAMAAGISAGEPLQGEAGGQRFVDLFLCIEGPQPIPLRRRAVRYGLIPQPEDAGGAVGIAEVRMGIVDAGVDAGGQDAPAGQPLAAGKGAFLDRIDAGGGSPLRRGQEKAFGLFHVGDLGQQADGFHRAFRKPEDGVISQKDRIFRAGAGQEGGIPLVADHHFKTPVPKIIAYRQLQGAQPFLRGGVQRQVQQSVYFLVFQGFHLFSVLTENLFPFPDLML